MRFATRLVAKGSKTEGLLRVNEGQRQHYERFRKVSIHYPRDVLAAYHGDFRRAMAHTDEQVAATIVAWRGSRVAASRARPGWREAD
jgi:hypothetical protein